MVSEWQTKKLRGMTTESSTPGMRLAEANTAETPPTKAVPYDQPWLRSLLRPFLIAVMVACLDIAWLALIGRFVPALVSGYGQFVLFFSVLVAIIGCTTTTYLAQPGERQRRRPTYRWVEFAFIVAATRLLLWAVTGSWPTLTALIYQPVDSLLDGLFFSAGLVVLFSWWAAIEMTGDLLRLALQPDELFALQTDRIGEMIRTSNSDRPMILGRIVSRWVGGGILMVMAAAGLQVERPAPGAFFALSQQNLDPTIIAAIVIYFLVGLVLVSHGQLALLRTRWLLDRVPASESVLRLWPLYVILLLVAIDLLAALLPFGGTFLLGQILFAVVNFVFNLFLTIFRFFMGLFMLLMAALLGEPPPQEAVQAPPPLPPPTIEQLPAATAHLPAWAGGALFWLTMALILGYAAYIYLSDRGVQFTWLLTFWQLLRERWSAFFGGYRRWQRSLVRSRSDDATTDSETPLVHWSKRGLDWRRLDPTQQVRYFYLTTLEQAKARGIGRTNGETPNQYAPRLAAHLSATETSETSENQIAEKQQAVLKLTEAFIQARYSRKTVATADSTTLARLWEKLKMYLSL